MVCEKFAAEGCNIAINYVSNEERAKQTAEKVEKEYSVKTVLIQGVSRTARCVPQWTGMSIKSHVGYGCSSGL